MNDNETQWTPTRRGGVRRTRVAQKTGTSALETSDEAKTIASVDVENLVTPSTTVEEHHSDEVKVGGSSPSPRTRSFVVKLNERLGLPSCPYVIRWRLETRWFSIRLHHWLAPDDDRAKHDHPWNFVTFVFRGGYVDAGSIGSEHLRAPAVRYRSASHQHTVFPDLGGAWTVVLTGPKVQPWGFWVNGKFKKANKYFATFGHHPCN